MIDPYKNWADPEDVPEDEAHDTLQEELDTLASREEQDAYLEWVQMNSAGPLPDGLSLIGGKGDTVGHQFRGNQYGPGGSYGEGEAHHEHVPGGDQEKADLAQHLQEEHGLEPEKFPLVMQGQHVEAHTGRLSQDQARMERAASDAELQREQHQNDRGPEMPRHVAQVANRDQVSYLGQHMGHLHDYPVRWNSSRSEMLAAHRQAHGVTKGGPGSGNFGHAGRAGERGGSSPGADAELAQDATRGGFTYNARERSSPITGFSVSPYKGLEVKVPIDQFKASHVRAFQKEHAKLLAMPDHQIGAWAEGGHIWLDVSVHVDSEQVAIVMAQQNRQEAYYDHARGISIPTPKRKAVPRLHPD